MNNQLKVAIVTTSVREGRVSLSVANWVKEIADRQGLENVEYEIVDLKDFALPMFGVPAEAQQELQVKAWKEKIAKFDAYVFVVAEYNHAITGVLKNALDFLKPELKDKVAGFVAYGGVGGARAVEGLRLVLAELSVACVQRNVHFLLAYDFEKFSVFKPQPHNENIAYEMLVQLKQWAKALKTIR